MSTFGRVLFVRGVLRAMACTGDAQDPYASGAHIACCSGLTEQLSEWDGNGRYYYKCIGGATGSALCSSNEGCASLGLVGKCCPHEDGMILACCNMGPPRRRSAPSPSRRRTTPTRRRGANSKDNYQKIICPFLSTLVHEDALPVRDTYTQKELTDLVLHAGLRDHVGLHLHGQFRSIRTGEIDIFNMEGLPDEHKTSTGINDCFSDYSNYQACPESYTPAFLSGVRVCPTANKACGVPSETKFDTFWSHFDTDGDDYLTEAEMNNSVDSFDGLAVDINRDPYVQGLMAPAFNFLIRVFGSSDRMSKSALMEVTLQRRYPSYYRFGQGCSSEWEEVRGAFQGSMGHELQFGILSFYDDEHSGRWLAIDGSNGAVITSPEKHLWTVERDGEWVYLRSSHNGRWLNVDPNGNLGSGSDPADWERWELRTYTTSENKVNLMSVNVGGVLNVNYDNYVPGIVHTDPRRDEEFTLIYCKLLEVPNGPVFA